MTAPSSFSAFLDVTHGPLQGQSLSLHAPETVIGRDPDCQVPLATYREVSRRHARFYLRDGTWCIEDLGSTNGTFVNNARATPSFSLAEGVVVQMGDFHARFRLAPVGVQPNGPNMTQTSPLPPIPQGPMPATSVSPVMPSPSGPSPVGYRAEPPKNIVVAILLSFLYAGLGQLYNGETSKAIPMLIGYSITLLLTLFCLVGFPFALGIAVWSIVDAYQNAERINRESGWQRPY